MSRAMIAMTTNSSIRVKALAFLVRLFIFHCPPKDGGATASADRLMIFLAVAL
jgi:hypothetical protein